jgi:hypothetical protein
MVTLENNSAGLYKTKHALAIQLGNHSHEYLSQEMKTYIHPKTLYECS